jgi:hypothetical protein
MTDYNKLKVADLKAELERRGVPTKGLKLKKNFVDKLIEDDASCGDAVEEERMSSEQLTREKQSANVDDVATQEPASEEQTKDVQQSPRQDKPEPVIEEEVIHQDVVPPATAGTPVPEEENPDEAVPIPDHPVKEMEVESLAPTAMDVDEPSKPLLDSITSIKTASQPVSSGTATPTDSLKQEVLEDTRKRKRRSQSPPPTSFEAVQKKAKALDGSPVVKFREDESSEQMVESRNGSHTPVDAAAESRTPVHDAVTPSKTQQKTMDAEKETERVSTEPQGPLTDAPTKTVPDCASEAEVDVDEKPSVPEEVQMGEPKQNRPKDKAAQSAKEEEPLIHDSKVKEQPTVQHEEAANEKVSEAAKDVKPESQTDKASDSQSQSQKEIISAPKPTSGDTRFKSLFSSTAAREAPPPPATGTDEERDISPAIHPATPGLYIRDLRRPFNPTTVRDFKTHLSNLATVGRQQSPNSESPESPILSFFIDSIRTHAFAHFRSTTFASRVRTALHGTPWPTGPNEAWRKPLFVDFIPAEKIPEWIEYEKSGASMKRYEVIYETTSSGDIEAVLREVGQSRSGPRVSILSDTTSQAPHSARPPPPTPKLTEQSQSQSGHGFASLDSLFSSTTAKPKLYYQPVSKSIAEKRLGRFEELARKQKPIRPGDNETRRFTFEDGERAGWVDWGVEAGAGSGRGAGNGGNGLGGFGNGNGGYRGTRGGYGGFRGGRGRRSGYGGDRGGWRGR